MNEESQTVGEMWDESFRFTRYHNREYHLNHAFLEGDQWLRWNPVENQATALAADDDRIHAVANRTRSNTRTINAKLLDRPLVPQVLPSGYDDVSLRGARLAEGILADLKKRQGWETKREGANKATQKGGTCAIAVEWDAKNGEPSVTPLGVPEFVFEPGARDGETARWWIKLQLLPPREVQAMFPDHFEDAPPPADGILGRNVEYSTLNRDEFPDLTRVYTYYERPNPLNETGCFKVEVDGKLVQKGKWPFPFTHRLNIAVMRESLIENEAYGSTIWSDVRSLQVAYNAAWSGFLENMRETALNRLLVDHEWEDQLETLSDRSGSVLVGDMTRPRPEYLKAPQTPRPLIQGIEMLRAEVDDILGVHKVAKGDAPANIESGLGIQLLIEQNDTPVGRLLDEGARAWSDVCSMVLQILEKEVTEKRTTVCRDGSGPVRREWTGKTIHGQTDVYISRESLTPKSRAAQQALAQNALQMGILGPPDDPMTVVRFVRFAEMPDARGLIASMNRDADRAIRENESVVMGEVPLPKMIDDHDIHIEIHEDFQKTLEFDQLSPEQQADHEAHLQAHRTMKAEALGETRMAQSIDPALGGVAPGPTPEPVPAPAPAPAPEPISPDQAAADMMQAIQNL